MTDENGLAGGREDAAAMRTFHETGVQRDDIHEHSEAELALEQAAEDFQFHPREGGVEK